MTNMNSINIINSLSTWLDIPVKVLNTLVKKTNTIIGSSITDAVENKEDAIMLNIGIGNLSINITTMQCKFIPSKELKATIKNYLNCSEDPLVKELEQSLINKLIAICDTEI